MRARLSHISLILTVLLLGSCRSEPPPQNVNGAPGAVPASSQGPAPDFSLPTSDRQEFRLSDHRGSVIVLNFWATWCAPCIVEVPELVAVQKEYGDRGVLVVGVSQDTGPEARGEVRDFEERLKVNYPLVLDSELEVSRSYGVFTLPTTLIVDADGEIRKRKVGLLKRDDIVEMLSGLLPGQAHEDAAGPSAHAPGTSQGEQPSIIAISAAEAGDLFRAGVMVVDLRSDHERLTGGHIPYALDLPSAELERSFLPANLAAPIVFIASEEALALESADRAAKWGYMNAYPVAGGFDAWRAAGLPVEAGPARL